MRDRFPVQWSDLRDLNRVFWAVWIRDDWTKGTLWREVTEAWIEAKKEDVDPRQWSRHISMVKTALFSRLLASGHSYEDILDSFGASDER